MNARLNKFIFTEEQPSTKRMISCAIFYVIMISICLYTYPSFLAYFDDNSESEIDYKATNQELNKMILVTKAELKVSEFTRVQMQKVIDIYEDKLDVRPVIEQHIINVNDKVFPQLAAIISNGIIEAEKAYPNIPYSIILAVMELESTFKYTARSKAECIGLMQVNPKVWVEELVSQGIIEYKNDLYDPTKNILAGTYILNHYYDQVDSENIKDKWEGALNKYFGTDSTDYFEKFQQFFGNFNLYMASYKDTNSIDNSIEDPTMN